jgi:putative oxidoreductase
MGPVTENILQRLFSTFAEGWPGFGLLLQRVLTSVVLLYFGGTHLTETTSLGPSLPHLFAALAGMLLLFGLWTPLAGTAIAIGEVWIFLARSGNPLIAIMLVNLGATVAMIGPGVWSIDAQLYGRKRIEPSRQ